MSMYELTDYNGQKLALTEGQAGRIAKRAKLIGVKVNGQIHYLNPSNIASIKPNGRLEGIKDPSKLIEAPDFRGRKSPAKEKIRDDLKKRVKQAENKPESQ